MPARSSSPRTFLKEPLRWSEGRGKGGNPSRKIHSRTNRESSQSPTWHSSATGWPEERILFMPLARLAQYQHCLLRRNGVRANWSSSCAEQNLSAQIDALRMIWVTNADPLARGAPP